MRTGCSFGRLLVPRCDHPTTTRKHWRRRRAGLGRNGGGGIGSRPLSRQQWRILAHRLRRWHCGSRERRCLLTSGWCYFLAGGWTTPLDHIRHSERSLALSPPLLLVVQPLLKLLVDDPAACVTSVGFADQLLKLRDPNVLLLDSQLQRLPLAALSCAQRFGRSLQLWGQRAQSVEYFVQVVMWSASGHCRRRSRSDLCSRGLRASSNAARDGRPCASSHVCFSVVSGECFARWGHTHVLYTYTCTYTWQWEFFLHNTG
jgi:hypothetical protein